MDDLESFMSELKNKAAAWAELEKKSKKSRRKKNDGKNCIANGRRQIQVFEIRGEVIASLANGQDI